MLVLLKEPIDRLQHLRMRSSPERRKGRAQVTTQRREQLTESVSVRVASAESDSTHVEVRNPQMRSGRGNPPIRKPSDNRSFTGVDDLALESANQRRQRIIRGSGDRVGNGGGSLNVDPDVLRIAMIENFSDVKKRGALFSHVRGD